MRRKANGTIGMSDGEWNPRGGAQATGALEGALPQGDWLFVATEVPAPALYQRAQGPPPHKLVAAGNAGSAGTPVLVEHAVYRQVDALVPHGTPWKEPQGD